MNSFQAHSIEKSPLAGELTFTESFGQTKEKLRHIFERLQQQSHVHGTAGDVDPIASGRLTTTPAITVDRIKRAVAIGLEVSTITNNIARFATGTPVHLTAPDETHRILHKFREKWPFLGLYQPEESLQATIVCDLLLSLANTVDTAANGFEVLQKLWPSTRDDHIAGDINSGRGDGRLKRGMGYVSFLRNAVDAMRQHQQHATPEQPAINSMQSLLSDDFLVISRPELAAWLDREKTFERIRGLQPDNWDSLDVLNGLQPQFKRLCSDTAEAVQMLARVNDFVQNTWRLLLRFAAADDRVPSSPTEILQTDLYDTVGAIVLGPNCDPSELEPLLCSMNMNLVHVIAVGVGTSVSKRPRCDSVSVDKLLLTIEASSSIVDNSSTAVPSSIQQYSDQVWAYLTKHNPMLSEILQRANGICPSSADELDNLKNLVQHTMHGENRWSAVLHYDVTSLVDVCAMLNTTNNYG